MACWPASRWIQWRWSNSAAWLRVTSVGSAETDRRDAAAVLSPSHWCMSGHSIIFFQASVASPVWPPCFMILSWAELWINLLVIQDAIAIPPIPFLYAIYLAISYVYLSIGRSIYLRNLSTQSIYTIWGNVPVFMMSWRLRIWHTCRLFGHRLGVRIRPH